MYTFAPIFVILGYRTNDKPPLKATESVVADIA